MIVVVVVAVVVVEIVVVLVQGGLKLKNTVAESNMDGNGKKNLTDKIDDR